MNIKRRLKVGHIIQRLYYNVGRFSVNEYTALVKVGFHVKKPITYFVFTNVSLMLVDLLLSAYIEQSRGEYITR